uniref:Uncharacterized protein n=1 Tax=Fusarium oxysporum (strain Fo5176) TaxID=660025 RepID=A0A0D2XSB9_FUSOF
MSDRVAGTHQGTRCNHPTKSQNRVRSERFHRLHHLTGYDHEVALSGLTIRGWAYTCTVVSTVDDIGEVFDLSISQIEIEINEKRLAGDRIQCKVISDGTADFSDTYNRYLRC